MLKLENVSKIYDGNIIGIKDVNLEFSNCGLNFVVGPSGNGKSTLLNIMGLLDKKSSGKLIVDGKDIDSLNQKSIDELKNTYFGFVFQEFYLDNNLTVKENILFPLEINDNKDDNYDYLVSLLGIKELENKKINEISGGERQRVSIARALICNPKVILADEPTGNLDDYNKKIVYDILKELSLNHLVIIVSHDALAARDYANRVIKIEKGSIISDNEVNHYKYLVNDKYYNEVELLDFINSTDSLEYNIKKVKTVEEAIPLDDDVKTYNPKNLSLDFILKYISRIFSSNKLKYLLDFIVQLILMTLIITIISFTFTNYKTAIPNYIKNKPYFNYVFEEKTSYVDIFNKTYYKELFKGKNLYNYLESNGLEAYPVKTYDVLFGDKYINTNVICDNTPKGTISVSNYVAVTYNLGIGDKIYIGDKELVVLNTFDTDYFNYSSVIHSYEDELADARSYFKNYNINYIKVNFDDLVSYDSLRINYSNIFYTNKIKSYGLYYEVLKSSNEIDRNINSNEIIVTTSFLNRYNKSKEDVLNKKFTFSDLHDEKYNRYYDDFLSLNEYFNDGVTVIDVVEDDNSSYFINDSVFKKLVNDYYRYIDISHYYVPYNHDTNGFNFIVNSNYLIFEPNINWLYTNDYTIYNFKVILIIVIMFFILLTSLMLVISINSSIKNQRKNIGIFKAQGVRNKDIAKIFILFNIIKVFLCSITATIIYTILYFIFINKMKNAMHYNQYFNVEYNGLFFIYFVVFMIINMVILLINLHVQYKNRPINLIR